MARTAKPKEAFCEYCGYRRCPTDPMDAESAVRAHKNEYHRGRVIFERIEAIKKQLKADPSQEDLLAGEYRALLVEWWSLAPRFTTFVSEKDKTLLPIIRDKKPRTGQATLDFILREPSDGSKKAARPRARKTREIEHAVPPHGDGCDRASGSTEA